MIGIKTKEDYESIIRIIIDKYTNGDMMQDVATMLSKEIDFQAGDVALADVLIFSIFHGNALIALGNLMRSDQYPDSAKRIMIDGIFNQINLIAGDFITKKEETFNDKHAV